LQTGTKWVDDCYQLVLAAFKIENPTCKVKVLEVFFSILTTAFQNSKNITKTQKGLHHIHKAGDTKKTAILHK